MARRAAAVTALFVDSMWLVLLVLLGVVAVLGEPLPETWRLSRPREQEHPDAGHYPQRGYNYPGGGGGGFGHRPAANFPPGTGPAQGSWPRPAPGPGFKSPNYPDYGGAGLDYGGGLDSICEYDDDCPDENAYCHAGSCDCKRSFKISADGTRCLATIGARCSSKFDCSGLGAGADCDQGVCHCAIGYVPSADGACIAGAQRVNDTCELNLQCESLGTGVACTDGRCQCVPGRHAYNDKCIANIALHASCQQSYECFIGEGYQSVVECYSGLCRCKDQYEDTGDGKCSPSGATRLSAVISSLVLGLLITSRV